MTEAGATRTAAAWPEPQVPRPREADRPRVGRPVTARAKLLDAAYRVMGRKGLDASTLAEIIGEAGVGVGSFYKHFSSKEDLAKAVFMDRADRLGLSLETAATRTANAAAAACFAFRRFIEEAEQDALWAAFMTQLEPAMPVLADLLRGHARTGLRDGVASGQLKIDDIEAGITAIGALIQAFVKARLSGRLTSGEAHRASLFALRMFGVAEAEAVRLSELPMDALRREVDRR
ncbi:TetR/AcrR family transcriptional regulator [Sphingomonas bacterium]|uniref:TetR/AcrR family transcriptional regulator n=1 Tax=Sphingomonas bacterium TaxID=1895847 RepID=UPI001576E993|nr:TetR/AcrR family transcriptional regulator [Sphingomonas bacterium]